VAAFGRGELVVSEIDLIRIFGLTTSAPPTPPVTVERFSGIYRYEPAVFTADGIPVSKKARAPEGPRGSKIGAPTFQFTDPTDCPTCNKKRASN
jgi:hypothetical protein